MIVEYIRYKIAEERRQAFVTAYRDAGVELHAAPDCLRYEVTRCTEEPSVFVVRIEWTSAEGHLQGFRKGPHFPPFLAKIRAYIPEIVEMRHYDILDMPTA